MVPAIRNLRREHCRAVSKRLRRPRIFSRPWIRYWKNYKLTPYQGLCWNSAAVKSMQCADCKLLHESEILFNTHIYKTMQGRQPLLPVKKRFLPLHKFSPFVNHLLKVLAFLRWTFFTMLFPPSFYFPDDNLIQVRKCLCFCEIFTL